MTKYKESDDIYDSNNHIKVYWEDTLDNRSRISEKKIEKYFQNKYKTEKVRVIFKAIANKDSGIVVQGNADASELVLDENYQKQLIEKYIADNKINIEMPYLMRLDSTVNLELENYKEQTSRYKTFKIKNIEFSNFLSFGDGNVLPIDGKEGIISIIGEPANFSGKTSLTIDLLLFLFFGQTTKSDKLEDIFNLYTDHNNVEVRGTVEIEGDNYIISRTINRKKAKDGTYTCKSEVDFYQELPSGGIKQLNGEQRRFTDDLIKNYVGSFDDFLITILTTGDNLDDLIRTKATERGRILTKFIGLEFFREKEKIAKKKYSEWKEKSKLYHNNSQDILSKIEEEIGKISGNITILISYEKQLESIKTKITKNTDARDEQYKKRFNDIDVALYGTNEQTINEGIIKLKNVITQKKLNIETMMDVVPEPKEEYDIDMYGDLKGNLKELVEQEITLKLEISQLVEFIKNINTTDSCAYCKRPWDSPGHDHGLTFAGENEKEKEEKETEWKSIKKNITNIETRITNIDKIKDAWDAYNKNKLIIDKANLELKAFEDSLLRGEETLNKYRKSKQMVEENQKIDTEIQKIKFILDDLDNQKNRLSLQLGSLEKGNQISENCIKGYNELLKELKSEEIADHIFKVYLDVYGKNGISKMVLSTMIPLINSYLSMLLSDTCEFNLEMRMNDKSEIEFWMIDLETDIEKPLSSGSGYEKTVSSLALRCVLSKVCSLPKPNIIVFDEVTGKVANDNLDKIGLFFDKLKQYFDHILIISHNPLIQDWADYVIKVQKTNNISTTHLN